MPLTWTNANLPSPKKEGAQASGDGWAESGGHLRHPGVLEHEQKAKGKECPVTRPDL